MRSSLFVRNQTSSASSRGFTLVGVIIVPAIIAGVALLASSLGSSARTTTTTQWISPQRFIPAEESKIYNYLVLVRQGTATTPGANRDVNFEYEGGLSGPASSRTNGNGIVPIMVTAPGGEGSGKVRARDANSGASKEADVVLIEWGPR